jgi:hypothetical protein
MYRLVLARLHARIEAPHALLYAADGLYPYLPVGEAQWQRMYTIIGERYGASPMLTGLHALLDSSAAG